MELLDLNNDWAANSMAKAILKKNSNMSKIILLEKYSDFSNVFDKAQANILLKHSQHNLVLKLKLDKQLFFSLIYDFSKFELNELYKYINEMLTKGFIILFKLFLEAFMLFTNKKDRDLHFCINYCSLNAIAKKNKHLFSLVKILLDCLIGLKRYTKLDIIATYNALCIRARNK